MEGGEGVHEHEKMYLGQYNQFGRMRIQKLVFCGQVRLKQTAGYVDKRVVGVPVSKLSREGGSKDFLMLTCLVKLDTVHVSPGKLASLQRMKAKR